MVILCPAPSLYNDASVFSLSLSLSVAALLQKPTTINDQIYKYFFFPKNYIYIRMYVHICKARGEAAESNAPQSS
jgi:hypothetical protein